MPGNMTIIKFENNHYLSERFSNITDVSKRIINKEFEECTFKNCDFSETTVSDCKFIDCHFIKCNLSLVDFSGTRLIDVFFEECKIIGVDWTNVQWPEVKLSSPVTFYNCILNDSTFFGLNLEELNLENCKLHDVDFREGVFREANFQYCDFTNSLFNNTDLTGSNFIEAINYRIDILFNEIKRCQFTSTEAIRLLDSLGIELVD